MTKNNILDILKSCRLFSNLHDKQLLDICDSCSVRSFHRGEEIRSKDYPLNCIALVLDGKAYVKKGTTIISTLKAGDFFGAVQLFGNSDIPPTDILAKTECNLLCLEKDSVISLITSDTVFAENFISYLTERIEFLTSRLGTISSGSVSDKLVTLMRENRELSVDCSNMSMLAKKLNVGRASLYRTVDALAEEGKIIKHDNIITLLEENYE